MKKTEYICDLCGESKKKITDSDESKHEIFEFYYGWSTDLKRNCYTIQAIKESCHKHICKACIIDVIETSPTGITLPLTNQNH